MVNESEEKCLSLQERHETEAKKLSDNMNYSRNYIFIIEYIMAITGNPTRSHFESFLKTNIYN